jgi:acetyl-CoA synthetase
VVAAPGVEPDETLTTRVATMVTGTLGPAFKPRIVRWVPDLPRTRSAKIMRRVVKAVALGLETGDLSSLENPESLDQIELL